MLRHVARLRRVIFTAPLHAVAILAVLVPSLTVAATIFAITDGVLFRPLPYPDANRLFSIQAGVRGGQPADLSVSEFDLVTWTAAAPEIASTAFRAQPWVGLGSGVNDAAAGVAAVQSNFFEVIGVRPLVGGFAPEDFQREAQLRPVIMTHGVWTGRFGGASDVIGRTIVTDASRQSGFRIAGVMPTGFVFPSNSVEVSFLTPLVPRGNTTGPSRDRALPEVIARGQHGMTADTLAGRIEQGMSLVAQSTPPAGTSTVRPFDQARAEPLATSLGRPTRPLFAAVFAAVLLLVACSTVNVSALAAARVLNRRRELQTRRALGASPASLARMPFLELLPVVSVAGLLSLAMTPLLVAFARRLLPDDLVLFGPMTPLGVRSITFVAVAVVGVSTIAALWPAMRTLRMRFDVTAGDRMTERHRSWGPFVVVSAQVAVGFVLLIGGLLAVGSLLAVYAHAIPIRTSDVLAIEAFVTGPGGTMSTSPQRTARVDQVVERLRRVRGVSAVAVTSAQVLLGGSWPVWLSPDGRPVRTSVPLDLHAVTADYFRVLEPRLVEGRLPTSVELEANARLLVVGERVARELWPNAPAVGQTMIDRGDAAPFTVVGVVKDVRWFSWDSEVASIYGPYALLSRAPIVTMLMRVADSGVSDDAVAAMKEVDPLLNPVRAAMLDNLFVDSVRPRRFRSWLFGIFAATALAIVAVGVAALVAVTTARRTREIGVRRALGATASGIVRTLLSEQLRPVLTGLFAGGFVAAWASTLLGSYLYGIEPREPGVWIAAALLITAVAAVGAFVPTARASRVDPVRALRAE